MSHPQPPEPSGWRSRKLRPPRQVRLSSAELVRTELLDPNRDLPLVFYPNVEGVNLAEWIGENLDSVERDLNRHGGLLFRGFGLGERDDFETFLKATRVPLLRYMESATPRTELGGMVYTSTEFPPSQSIALHNELTYVQPWPMKIFFFCQHPADVDGATPIADVRRVYRAIPPEIRNRFKEKGWMLVRNFGDGLGLPWRSVYHVPDRVQAEAYFHRHRIEFRWKDGDRLRTRQTRAAVLRHPVTGDWVWFNHVAFWHKSGLHPDVRHNMESLFSEEEFPYATYYGDGAPIEDEVVERIMEAYRAETVAFPWQKGDLLMLDNMLVAHGRQPFSGNRRVIVAMGEAYDPGSETLP